MNFIYIPFFTLSWLPRVYFLICQSIVRRNCTFPDEMNLYEEDYLSVPGSRCKRWRGEGGEREECM